MKKYYIQEHLLNATVPTIVRDSTGKQCFLIIGKWGRQEDVLAVYTMEGILLASVKQPESSPYFFHLYHQGKKIGSIRKILSLQKDVYYVSQLSWVAIGNISDHHYTIYSFNKRVMYMEKYANPKGNFYHLSICDEKNVPVCLCIASILDYWQMNRKKNEQFIRFSSDFAYSYKYQPLPHDKSSDRSFYL